MATFYECPPVAAATTDTINITTNQQLRDFISNRENGNGPVNGILSGTFHEIFVENTNGIHFWLTPGTAIEYTGASGYPGGSVIRFKDTNDFGVHGVNGGGPVDSGFARPRIDGNSSGNNGATWGIVIGNSFLGDPNAGPCSNGVIEGLEVVDVRQELVKIAETGTNNISLLCCEIHRSGRNMNGSPFGEGVYIGQGSGGDAGTEFLNNILVQGNEIYETFFGEGIDVKRGSRDVFILDNYLHDLQLPFAGGITFWSDDLEAGSTGNSVIARNRVGNVQPAPGAFTPTIEAIEIGQGALVENNVLWGFTGRGINLVRQFAGVDKTVEAFHNTIDASSGIAAFGVNVEAPNGGNNPGTLDACGNLYVGTHIQGTLGGSTNDQQYSSGFVGPPGSSGEGYALTASSPHVDTAPSCGTGNDICLESRPGGSSPDFGAFEIVEADELVDLTSDSYTGTVGTAFSQNTFANDTNFGDPTTTCAVTSGAVPPGMTWNPTTGVLSGTPTVAGSFSFNYTCTDSDGDTDTATVRVVIGDDPTPSGGRLRCILS